MTHSRLAQADPAAGYDYRADSAEARELLARITASGPTAPDRPPTAQRRALGRHPRLALAVAGVAASAIVIVPAVTGGGSHPLISGAYAVTTAPDGSVKMVIHWSQATDVVALQKALDAAHARTKVLTATEDRAPRIGDPLPPVQACAVIHAGTVEAPERAVVWHSEKPVSGVIIRPDLFPAGETLVLEIVFIRSTGAIAEVSSTLAVAPLPTCVNAGERPAVSLQSRGPR